MRLGTTVAALADRSEEFFNSDDESPLYGVQDGYAKLDARIELYPTGSRWTLALVGTNLTNELTTAGAFPPAGADHDGDPRALLLRRAAPHQYPRSRRAYASKLKPAAQSDSGPPCSQPDRKD